MSLYGKPIVNLTYLQVELLNSCGYYKNIISNSEYIPEEVRHDPEKIDDWYSASQNARTQMEARNARSPKTGSGVTMSTAPGATKEDIKYAGLDKGARPLGLASMIKEKGGMSLDEINRL
jgi:hypothetical protein